MPLIDHLTQAERDAIEGPRSFRIVPETWGMSIRPGRDLRRRATLVEWCAQFMAFLTLFVTIGIVATAGSLRGQGIDPFEIAVVFAGFTMCAAFFYVGVRGTALELQIDNHRRELRTAVRNWRGGVKILETHAHTSIEGLYVLRRSRMAQVARLCIRTHSEPEGVEVLAGNASGLDALHEAISRGMKASRRPKTRIQRSAKEIAGRMRAQVG